MSEKPSILDDPVVAEVREARRRMWEEAGRDFNRLRALLDREIGPAPRDSVPLTPDEDGSDSAPGKP